MSDSESPGGLAPGRTRYWVLITWPAFLAACVLEAVVFAMVDPGELHWPGRFFQATRQGAYTMAFFTFWAIAIACSALVLWLAQPTEKINGNLVD